VDDIPIVYAKLQKKARWRSWFLPDICVLCRQDAEALNLCLSCQQQLPYLKNVCWRCGASLFGDLLEHAFCCPACTHEPPLYDRFCSLFAYQGLAKQLVLNLKFAQQLAHAEVLGSLLAIQLAAHYKNGQWPELVIAVPLSLARWRYRGFNQTQLILKYLLRFLKKHYQVELQTDDTCLIKTTETRSQASLNRAQRLRNLRTAFCLQQWPHACQHVAILDDVFTTGSTVTAITAVLKAAGVDIVDVWCVCRNM
jgi:ComF family protein